MVNQINSLDKYDVFLSYRRDGGETMAILLRDRLVAKGYKVFLDIESLNSGSFNKKLLSVIENCIDVVIVCSKNSLDRCVNEGDWVRTEIAHALKCGKNVVPIMLRGFDWPAVLPNDIVELQHQNGVNASNNEYFDAAIDRLTGKFLQSVPYNPATKTTKTKKGLLDRIIGRQKIEQHTIALDHTTDSNYTAQPPHLSVSSTATSESASISPTIETKQVLQTPQPVQIKEDKTATPISIITSNQNLYGNTMGNLMLSIPENATTFLPKGIVTINMNDGSIKKGIANSFMLLSYHAPKMMESFVKIDDHKLSINSFHSITITHNKDNDYEYDMHLVDEDGDCYDFLKLPYYFYYIDVEEQKLKRISLDDDIHSILFEWDKSPVINLKFVLIESADSAFVVPVEGFGFEYVTLHYGSFASQIVSVPIFDDETTILSQKITGYEVIASKDVEGFHKKEYDIIVHLKNGKTQMQKTTGYIRIFALTEKGVVYKGFNDVKRITFLDENNMKIESGNTAGNIYNGGSAAIQGDWIYFCVFGNKLYKIKTDGSECTLLTNDINSSVGYLSVVGDWIYYQYHCGNDWGIYRIKTDGTDKEKLTDGSGGNPVAVGDSLFYIDNYQIVKLDLQTKRRKTFKILNVFSFGVFKENIIGHIAGSQGFIVDLDGNNFEKLNFGNCCISEHDGFYYYIDYINEATTQRFIMKRPINGGNPIKLAEGFSFNIANGWIYFDNSQDDNGLYKMKLDGSEKTKLTDGYCERFSIVGDWIYYQYSSSFYRIKTDGTEEENLNDVVF